jgi:hypothetical protein
MVLKDFFEDFFKTIKKYSKNISPKAITKAIKKQVGVLHVIPFAPSYLSICLPFFSFICIFFHIFLSSQFCLYMPFFVFSLPTLSPSFICFVLNFISICSSPFMSLCVSLDGVLA